MLEIRKVLFPTDFSDAADAALRPALRLADLHGAELHMFHAVVLHADDPFSPEHHFPAPDEVALEMGRIAEEKLEDVASGFATAQVDCVRVQRRAISAAPAILEYAAEAGIDLIVMGSHGRRGLRRMFMGSVAEEVIRRSDCPVLAVRGPDERPWPSGELRRIVVPTDFSRPADHALEHAVQLAEATGARLDLLHVMQVDDYPDFYYPVQSAPALDLPRLREDARETLRRTLARASVPSGTETDVHVTVGHPAAEIADFCEAEDVDLVVLSTHGRTGLRRMLLGSVAEAVLRQAVCPLFLVKPGGRSLLPEKERETENGAATETGPSTEGAEARE